MTAKEENDNSLKKQIIDFDMFVSDLEPEQDEKIRGGGKSANHHEPNDCKPDRQ